MTQAVLFLCTGNSARSIIAECLLTRLGEGRFAAFSAGSRPAGAVHPFARRLLERRGYDVSRLRSKSWDEFALPGAPEMDFIITVCDAAAGEACPVWPGHPGLAHWGIPDPAAAGGTQEEVMAAFEQAHGRLERRIGAFLALTAEHPGREALLRGLRAIGKT